MKTVWEVAKADSRNQVEEGDPRAEVHIDETTAMGQKLARETQLHFL